MPERRQRDKEQTVQEIITAAKQLFSEKGLHGTSLRDIESASGVSKGLILHHFETKENLYAAVQDVLIQEYTTWMAKHRQTGDDLEEVIKITISQALAYIRENKEFRRISLWSYLEEQEKPNEFAKGFTSSLIAGIREGQESGLIRDDVDAHLMPFIIRGALDYWLRSESLRKEISDTAQGLSDKALVDALVKLLFK